MGIYRTGLVLVLLVAYVLADLPSCSRARCSHCDVEFISRMCPTVCGNCAQTVVDTSSGTRLRVFPENNRPPQPPVLKPFVKSTVPVRQHAAPIQNVQQQPAYLGSSDTATLAPLISQPQVDFFNPSLARQPADLAQPLPEYHNGVPQAQPYYQQQQQVQQPSYNTNSIYGQQPQPNPFGQGLGGAQPNLFPGLPQPGSSPFANPFQPFLQQSFSASGLSALDPLGLLNLGGSGGNSLAQAAPLATVNQHSANTNPIYLGPQFTPQHQSFQAPQQSPPIQQRSQTASTAYNGNYQPQQSFAPQRSSFHQPPPAQPQVQFPQGNGQQPFFQMPNLQLPQVPPSPLAPVNIHNQAPYQTNSQAQQVVPQQQGQQQQVQQPQQPTPVQTSQSIDASPVNYQKYVGEKISAPPPSVAQCPRQPGWGACISKEQANDRFRNCCARLGDGCSALCHYDATLATMQLAVLTGRCPLNKVGDMMICASGYQDATPCCEAYNVFEPGYEHCRPYCNPAAGIPSEGPLSEKYKCLIKLSAIQQCFYVSQKP